MKRIPLLTMLAIAAVACQPQQESKQPEEQKVVELKDSEELKKLHDEDQNDRRGEVDWSEVMVRDSARLARVYQLLDSNKVVTAVDYYHAAMVFQHGMGVKESEMAVKMMEKAIELDSSMDKWLLAAAVDRHLMRKGEPQIYGTQYRRDSQDGPWYLYEIDTTQVTDEERKAHRVETLAEQKERVKQMNRKQLFAVYQEGKTIEEMMTLIQSEQGKDSEYDVTESGINNLGYDLMGEDKDEEALKIFKLNTELFPEGYNTYDSYGECLLKMGRKEEAIEAYKKSLELNPENVGAKEILKKHAA